MKTTTINNVQVTEEQLRNALAEIEAQDKPFPQEGDTWYSYDEDGAILEGEWGTSLWYLRVLAIGNVYRTREEAERVVAQRKAETKVCRRLRELEGDYVVKFEGKQHNYFPVYNHVHCCFSTFYYVPYQTAPPHWHSTEAAWQQVISEMEDDVKVMLGVEV